jgi:cation diffusion facilitator family transporter
VENEPRDNLRASKAVLAANAFLILAKLVVAILTGSIAAIAVLIDSLMDMVGALFLYFGVRKGSEPPDVNHLYGHKKYETISSIAQISLIAIAAFLIAAEALNRFSHPRALDITLADLAIMAVAVAVDIWVVSYLKKHANLASPAIQASVGNYSSDILQNSLVLVGLFATGAGFHIADPIAALIVAFLMFRVVYWVGKGAFGELTDIGPPKEMLGRYALALRKVRGVKSFHKLRARIVGGETLIDVHVQLWPGLSISRAHAICASVKHTLIEKFPEVREVLVHPEPYSGPHKRGPKFGS